MDTFSSETLSGRCGWFSGEDSIDDCLWFFDFGPVIAVGDGEEAVVFRLRSESGVAGSIIKLLKSFCAIAEPVLRRTSIRVRAAKKPNYRSVNHDNVRILAHLATRLYHPPI